MSINGLRREVWAQASPSERLDALKSLENQLAQKDNRQIPCRVNVSDLGSRTRGVHGMDESGNEFILVNASLVNDPQTTPYQAVETLFHEDQHAHQMHVLQHPELADDPQQLQDWQMSEQDGYISPEEAASFSEYRWQPTEKDANEQARQKTNELFQDEFADTEQYPDYKQAKEQELSDDVTLARHELGEDYVAEARQSMIANHEYHQAQKQGSLASTGQDQGTEEQPTPEMGTSPGEDEGYSYGYGM